MATLVEIVDQWMKEQEELVVDNYDRFGLRASGRFAREVYTETKQTGTKIVSNLDGPSYAVQMNDGRGPNESPSREAVNRLYPAILEWQQNKPSLPAELKTKGSAWGIAYKIVFSGINVPNSFNQGGFLTKAFTPDRYQVLYDAIRDFYVEDTRMKFNEGFKQQDNASN